MHHQHTLCTTDLRWAPWCTRGRAYRCLWEVGITRNIFHFWWFTWNMHKMDTFCPYLVGHKNIQHTLFWETPRWCTMQPYWSGCVSECVCEDWSSLFWQSGCYKFITLRLILTLITFLLANTFIRREHRSIHTPPAVPQLVTLTFDVWPWSSNSSVIFIKVHPHTKFQASNVKQFGCESANTQTHTDTSDSITSRVYCWYRM